jgi:hypothetical protein
MTIEELKGLYCCLYDRNTEAAEEDYLEEYEANYSPERLNFCETAEDVKSAIVHLVGELVDDTGDEGLVREWLMESGADNEILTLCRML